MQICLDVANFEKMMLTLLVCIDWSYCLTEVFVLSFIDKLQNLFNKNVPQINATQSYLCIGHEQ